MQTDFNSDVLDIFESDPLKAALEEVKQFGNLLCKLSFALTDRG